MDCFCKIEIAGVIEVVACDRDYKKLRLLIHIPPEGVDVVTVEKNFGSLEIPCSDYIPLDITGDAYDVLIGKIYDFDFIHVLANVNAHSAFSNPPISFSINRAGQIICHKPRSHLNNTDKGNDIYKPLRNFYTFKEIY